MLEEPETVIRLHTLGESSVDFIIRPWAKTDDYWTVYWDITRAVKKRFDEEGISIPFPQRDVHLFQQVPATNQAPNTGQSTFSYSTAHRRSSIQNVDAVDNLPDVVGAPGQVAGLGFGVGRINKPGQQHDAVIGIHVDLDTGTQTRIGQLALHRR